MIQNSLIIPVFNGSKYLPLFWTSLLDCIDYSYELIIIDDGSDEDIKSTIPRSYSEYNILHIRNSVNIGYAASVNKGIRKANGDFLFLLNTDLIFESDTLKELKRPLNDSHIGIVGAKLLYPQTNKIQHFGVAFSKTRKFHVYTHMDRDNSILSNNIEVQATTFALVCLKKELIKTIGYLNEDYFNGCEDIDYSLRVRSMNYKIIIAASAVAYHWESQSGTARQISTPDNEARFWACWGGKIELDYLKYLRCSIVSFLSVNEFINEDAIIINLSSSIESFKYIDKIKEGLVIENECLDFRQKNSAKYHLWLPMILPLDLIRTNSPIIYYIDEITQILQNSYWFSTRSSFSRHDLVIDSYSNIISMDELDLMFVPARLKSKEDVS